MDKSQRAGVPAPPVLLREDHSILFCTNSSFFQKVPAGINGALFLAFITLVANTGLVMG